MWRAGFSNRTILSLIGSPRVVTRRQRPHHRTCRSASGGSGKSAQAFDARRESSRVRGLRDLGGMKRETLLPASPLATASSSLLPQVVARPFWPGP